MNWKTTEAIYGEMLELEREAWDAMSRASSAENEARKQTKLAEEEWDLHRWKMEEVRELKAELLKRANATKEV